MNELFISVVSGVLTVFFLFACSIKILGWQKMIFETQLAFFYKYGLNRTIMALVGFIELAGAVTLWLPGYLGLAGVLLLFATSAGAIFFHLSFDTWQAAIPAMVTILLSAVVSYAKYSALTGGAS